MVTERQFLVSQSALNSMILAASKTTRTTGLLPDSDGLSEAMIDSLIELGLLTELTTSANSEVSDASSL